ncbi:MAG: GNAT family N-acetyltransferase [Proteobacteria bacterium]|nr:GNAT family N-acetyltransferase [Pseudomonadota bacterium]
MIFAIRPAVESDIPALAHIHVEGWRDSYGGIVRQEFIDGLSEEKQAEDWKKWFAEGSMQTLIAHDETGKAAGLIGFGKLRTPIPGGSPIRPLYSSEIYAIYILKECQRQGLGRRLMREAALKLREMKHRSACLWVLEKNEKAASFYKMTGGQRCGKKDIEIGGTKVKDIAFGWRDTSVLCGP